jgi:hypothetical protein
MPSPSNPAPNGSGEGSSSDVVLNEDASSDVLRLQALAALRRTRMKASGNLNKTRMAVEVVSEESVKDPEDSRLMRTLKFDSSKINGALGPCDAPDCTCVRCAPAEGASATEGSLD